MLYEKILHISERGQVVIPKKARDIMGLGKNGALKLSFNKQSELVLKPIRGFTAELEGSAKDIFKGKDITKTIRDLRAERT